MGMFNRGRLTISIGVTGVRALVVQKESLLRWASVPLPDGAVRNGQVAEPAVFGRAVRELIEEVGGPRRRAVVSLSGRGALVRIMDMPPVPKQMLEEAVRREARRELPLPLEELYLSWRMLGHQDGSRIQVFLLGMPREAVDNCVVGLRDAGVRPLAMDLKPLALTRAVNRSNVVLVNLEGGAGSVVLVRDFVPRIVRSVALPSGEARSLNEQVDDLIVEVQRTLDFYNSTATAVQPSWSSVLCLTGALGEEKEVRSRFEARWPLAEPTPPMSLPDELPLLPYLVNVGLALKDLS